MVSEHMWDSGLIPAYACEIFRQRHHGMYHNDAALIPVFMADMETA